MQGVGACGWSATVVAAATQTAENDKDVHREQQQASASVKRLKHIKDKVLTGAWLSKWVCGHRVGIQPMQ